jgi:hypothetical protein
VVELTDRRALRRYRTVAAGRWPLAAQLSS